VLLSLEPEEVGAKLLFLLRSYRPDPIHFGNMMQELWYNSHLPDQTSLCPEQHRDNVELALSEAWAWLLAQGLLVPSPGQSGSNGWMVLSRRARKFESETDVAEYLDTRMLRRESLHPKLAKRVWESFMRGDFDGAVFHATKAVEVSVREASGLGTELVGTALMRKAFDKNSGRLTDQQAEAGEKDAVANLFAGAMGYYKNPQSHREVNLANPFEAYEVIMFANSLLRIVDARKPK
jgi:uncharacterized protein (TIGR02391 family)